MTSKLVQSLYSPKGVFLKHMLTIRLQRHGRKNDPSFRVVVVESKKKPKTGNYLEMVGSYDPRVDRIDLKGDRIKHWLSNGVTVSDTVHNLLVTKGIIEGKKINVLPKKTAPKKEEEVQAEAPAPEPAPEAPAEEAPAEEAPVASPESAE